MPAIILYSYDLYGAPYIEFVSGVTCQTFWNTPTLFAAFLNATQGAIECVNTQVFAI